MIRKLDKIILVFIIIILLVSVYSVYSVDESPISLSTSTYPSTNSHSEAFVLYFGNVSSYALGQSAKFFFAAGTLIFNWTNSEEFLTTVYVMKNDQQLSFPFDNASVTLSDFKLTVNGIPVGLMLEGVRSSFNDTAIGYVFQTDSPGSFSGVIHLTFSADIHLILYSWIYHVSLNQGIHQFSGDLALNQ